MADTESDQLFENKSVGILYFIVGFIGILSNSLVLRVFLRDGILNKPKNILHVNLCIGNILVVACFPFSGLSSFHGRWLFGSTGCNIYGVESFIAGIASLSFVLMLCVERYWANCKKSLYDTTSSGTMWFISILVWLHAALWGLFPLFGWNSYSVEPSGVACGLNWLNHDYSHTSYTLALSVEFLVFFVIAAITMNAAWNFDTGKEDEANAKAWFSEKQLNWICFTFLLIAAIGWSPYAYFAIWTLNSEIKVVTILAATLPPLVSKASVTFYAIPYMVANERFRDLFTGQSIVEGKRKSE